MFDASGELNPTSDNLVSTGTADCPLVQFGMAAMRKSLSGFNNSNSSFNNNTIVSSEVSTTSATMTSALSTSVMPTATNSRRKSHGSMLSSLKHTELEKIAQTVSNNASSREGASGNTRKRASVTFMSAGGINPQPEDLMGNSSFKSRASGPFIVMQSQSASSPRVESKKRKLAVPNSSDSSSSFKRGKQLQQPSVGSVFDFLS